MRVDHPAMDPHSGSRLPILEIAESTPYISPSKVTLSDGRHATIYAFFRSDNGHDIEVCTAAEREKVTVGDIDLLVDVLWKMLNLEIEGGKT